MAGDATQPDPAPDPALDRRITDARPDADPLTRAVWRSQVARALFGDAEPVAVGRYQLVRQLGRGGGGSVFVASDPELHREVAVKLIRCASDRHRERALAEGRALARLSHPNVVAVHDVGETAEHVYLVMELLRGESLREFAGPGRTVRELVTAYRQAASGLAAAHAAGLVHRDFKPDNAMFDDGRLRVVDFGLATGTDDEGAAPAGTPRYMAPEQRAGGRAEAAADQYALAASLREAVTTQGRDEPAWLARVLARATADEPGDRYPSLAELARALGDDPRTRWRRRGLVATPIALAIAGFAIGRGATSGAEPCGGNLDALAPTWTPARVDEVVQHVAQIQTPFAAATAPRVREQLGALERGWLAAHARACTAHARGELSDLLHERSILCLDRSRVAMAENLGLLAAATANDLDRAATALSAVVPADRCADPVALAAEANPQPTPVMRLIAQLTDVAEIHARARTPRATALAQNAASLARSYGDPHLVARALLVLGQAQMYSAMPAAQDALHEAMLIAAANRDESVAIEAFARHAFVFANLHPGDRPRALDGLEFAGALAGNAGGFARALLANNVGAVAMLLGDIARAREQFKRAVTGGAALTDQAELLIAVSNLALLTPDSAARRELYRTAVARATDAVGPDHPQTLELEFGAIADLADPDAVVAALSELCRRVATLHPTLDRNIDSCALELAWQATAIGLPDRVRDAAALVVRRDRELGERGRLVLTYAALASGGATRAQIDELDQLARKADTELARTGWIHNWVAANASLALAAAAHAVGDPRARPAATAAIGYLEAYRGVTGVSSGSLERRLRWARQLRGGD